MSISQIVRIALLATASHTAGGAVAQAYPSKPVQLVVPFAASGSIDVVFRTVAPPLSERLGQQVLVVNRPGASATIGMNQVARSAADGYTLGVASLSFAANPPFMAGKMPFDTEKDLVPIVLVARVPLVLVVHPGVAAKSAQELITLAKAKPDALNYTSSGIASSGHLAAALFLSMTGVRMTHVPYTTTLPAAGVVAGQVDLLFAPVTPALPFIKAGKLRALGVSISRAVPTLPDVPSIAETVSGFEVFEWMGLVAPTATPHAIIDRLNRELRRTLEDAQVRQRIAAVGAEPVGNSPEEFGIFIRKELRTWAKVGADIQAVGTTSR